MPPGISPPYHGLGAYVVPEDHYLHPNVGNGRARGSSLGYLNLSLNINFSTSNASLRAYDTRDSLAVTDPTTSLALTGLSMGERTGSRVFL
ncbi:hypothetical protein B0H67DRAFT_478527 [Lasiosphaeris hirsuta]|uniref:Uncharacterized protein n=1 Tax=Lasiosphaeris hirsuta TaxID=260670 RepID=A0AA40BDU6_9PEZI|nr:hypothetical protein B0H67DRAFT_478527 [Lasiosphaeris hirsuta]